MLSVEREIKQVIVIRKDLKMGTGKIAAQASHASLMAYMETLKKHKDVIKSWLDEGSTKVVLKVQTKAEFDALKKRLSSSTLPFRVIVDAGQTQIPPGTETAIGIGPYYSKAIDEVTGDLKLL